MDKHLAAILYADVVGYSRLVGHNEEQTHRQLSDSLNLLTDTIAAGGGQKIHEAGDAILAEFASVSAAVEAAMEFQRRMAARDLDTPEDESVQFRIGINLGEVIRDRGDIYGEGVNIAARIQDIAPAGGLCVSGAVFDQLAASVEFNYDDLGYRDFKNIKRPVHVYRIRPHDPSEAHPMSGIESGVRHQPLFDDGYQKKIVTRGGCACGSIAIEITQEPLGTGFCHCRMCTSSMGAPVFAWVAFPVESVRFVGQQPKRHRLSLIGERGFCANCGTPVMWRALKPEAGSYLAIPTTVLENPEDYAPTWHGGIESQMPWLQVHDDLTRARCPESPFLRDAWGSMGAEDPDQWITLDYEKSKQLAAETDDA